MKRKGNLYCKIYDIENLHIAAKHAKRGKKHQPGIKQFLLNESFYLQSLHELLIKDGFKNSVYHRFIISDPKEREIFRLPFYPDRILHHAILNIIEPIFNSHFISGTYSSIKGRGIHSAATKLKKALRNDKNEFCLKLDIKKFYPSIDNDILKQLLRKKFKDSRLLNLLDEIIDSTTGVPIGNYLSQFLANYYLSEFDHWIKEVKKIKEYYRYADDIVILADNKEDLHSLLVEIKEYLYVNLKLHVKGNYQVFPVSKRGIDFLGYVFYPGYTLLRKSIKKRFAKKIKKGIHPQSMASYMGWCKHANTINLVKKLLNENVQIV